MSLAGSYCALDLLNNALLSLRHCSNAREGSTYRPGNLILHQLLPCHLFLFLMQYIVSGFGMQVSHYPPHASVGASSRAHRAAHRLHGASFCAARPRFLRNAAAPASAAANSPSTSQPTEVDRQFMRQALTLASTALGKTYPNPAVGCVIVKDGVVVGEGYHPKAGMPHAEVYALRAAGAQLAHFLSAVTSMIAWLVSKPVFNLLYRLIW